MLDVHQYFYCLFFGGGGGVHRLWKCGQLSAISFGVSSNHVAVDVESISVRSE